MEGRDVTTSGVISFAEQLEDRSAQFYQRLSDYFPAHADLFKTFAREDRMNKTLVIRTYQETVTDALETGYSFEGLKLDGAVSDAIWEEKSDLRSAIDAAVELEESAASFYDNIAHRSQTLLSTIPMVFRKIAGNRKARSVRLRSLIASD